MESTTGKEGTLYENRFHALGRATGSMVWTTGPTGLMADMPDWSPRTGQSVEASNADRETP